MSLHAAGPVTAAKTRPSLLRAGIGWALRHWIALVASCWVVSGALYLTLPPSPDQFEHAYLGWRLLAGEVPYRDFIDPNWPGVMALHALATWIFGVHLWTWRAFDFALYAVSALFLADVANRAAGPAAGKLGLMLSPLVYAGASYWVSGQHDTSAAQFLAVALWFHVCGYERRAWWYQIGTGICIGAAMLNKPTLGVIGLLLPLHALALGVTLRQIVAHTTAAGVAALATLLSAFSAVLALGTSGQELIDAVYTYNVATQYIALQTLPVVSPQLRHIGWAPILALGSIWGFWILSRKNRSLASTAPLVLVGAGVLSYFIQSRGMSYHLAPCLIALTAVFGMSVAVVADGRIGFATKRWRRAIIVGIVAASFVGIGSRLAVSYRALPQAILTGDFGPHLARFEAGDRVTYADVDLIVRWLKAFPSRDCVLLVGDASAINYLAERAMPTRFYYYHVLVLLQPPLPLAERWIGLWEQDLRAATCRFALVSQQAGKYWGLGPGRAPAALRNFLQSYRELGKIGSDDGIAVYERM